MSKKKKVIYQGLFLDAESLELLNKMEGSKKLERDISSKHITFEIYPTLPFPDSLMGQNLTVDVVGYGNNGHNSGFEVVLSDELYSSYKNNKRPHITSSVSLTGEPKNTASLYFKPITPFKVTGVLGYYYGKEIIFNNDEIFKEE